MVAIGFEVLGALQKKNFTHLSLSYALVSMFGLTNRLHYTLKIIKKVRLKRYVT